MVDEVERSEELSMYALVRRLRPGVALTDPFTLFVVRQK